jgi:hypothetical protein
MSILTPAAKCADREYDVAISFLVVDENIAASIKGGLSGLNVFFYPHNQEDLIGTNGIETMRAPFLSARVNVILFRERYSKTPWTGVELSAIQDAASRGATIRSYSSSSTRTTKSRIGCQIRILDAFSETSPLNNSLARSRTKFKNAVERYVDRMRSRRRSGYNKRPVPHRSTEHGSRGTLGRWGS